VVSVHKGFRMKTSKTLSKVSMSYRLCTANRPSVSNRLSQSNSSMTLCNKWLRHLLPAKLTWEKHLYRMFPGGREALWEEKLGLAPKFAGNAATKWGTNREADTLLR